jgi:hypothetical protein
VEGFTAGIELLPLVAWHGLDQTTREHHLREWAGLASDAAAVAVAAGDPARAVELLEAGRSMLWTQALHRRGGNLSAVQFCRIRHLELSRHLSTWASGIG